MSTPFYVVVRENLSCRQTKSIRKSRIRCVTCGALLHWDSSGGVCSENPMSHPGGEWRWTPKKAKRKR